MTKDLLLSHGGSSNILRHKEHGPENKIRNGTAVQLIQALFLIRTVTLLAFKKMGNALLYLKLNGSAICVQNTIQALP